MLRPLSAERLLALGAALVGVIGIVSALTPEMADRIKLVGGVLPPGWPEAARVLTVVFGIGLIWLSRSLAKRRRRAWQLAVAVVVASAAAHLAKGLDFEEATISLLLLAALVRFRGRFDVPGDPASVRPLLGLGAALAGVAAVVGGAELRGVDFSPRTGDALLGLGVVLASLALYFWLRPFGHAVAQTVGERRIARQLVDSYGSDSLSFFALRRDKSYLFSPSGRAFLAYRVVAGTALVSGDPVGDEAEIDDLLAELRRIARASGWRFAVVGASDAHLERYRALGLKPVPIGDEAVLDPTRVLARRTCDPQGAPVGHPARQGRLLVPRGRGRRGRARPGGGARRTSRTPGAAASPSAASRWRSTTSTSPAPCSPSRRMQTAGSAASSTSRLRRREAAGR